jgi:5-methylcytosine-specific restriction endonuclease McrA
VTGNGVKDEMNRVLGTHYGYDRAHGSTAPHDTDHVWEKQLGGQDAEANLWPLNAGTNRSSGGTVRGEIERVRRELGIPASVRGLAGRWLRLRAA